VLCLLLGLAVAVQVRQHTDDDLASLRQSELVGVLDDATERNNRLQQEITDLVQRRDELRSSGDQREAAREAAQQRLDTLGILAGTLPATGPGITMVLHLPREVPSDALPASTQLLGAVQELRDAGAEAIQINGVRIVASTAFTEADGGSVLIGQSSVDAPFTVLAIGDPQTLAAAMDFPDGTVSAATQAGGSTDITQSASVEITALQPESDPAYARPATPSDSSTP
jgi:uncharacterized protein YlxW (UPF0749 family)